MLKFAQSLAMGFFDKLNYSVVHMTIPQWGIVTGVALTIGLVMLKAKR